MPKLHGKWQMVVLGTVFAGFPKFIKKLRLPNCLLAWIVSMEIDPPFISRCNQLMGYPFAQSLWGSFQICPALLEFNESLCVKDFCFGRVAGFETKFLLPLAYSCAEVLCHAFTQPINSSFGMLPGTCHCKSHVYHPCVPIRWPEPLQIQ